MLPLLITNPEKCKLQMRFRKEKQLAPPPTQQGRGKIRTQVCPIKT